MGFIEADLIFPMGTHVFKTEALLLVLATTEYQKRVPVTIGTSLTDMAVDSLGLSDTAKLSPMNTSTDQTPSEKQKEDDPCIPDELDLGELSTWSEEQ